MKWIGVFGSGTVSKSDPVYQDAMLCGEKLAHCGFGVITGGYFGVMEAASLGAHKAGGRVRSVPCREFRRDSIHPYTDEVIWTARYEDRIRTLVALADGFIIFPGGIGTLAELFYVWSLAQVRSPEYKPFVCIGEVFFMKLEKFLRSYSYIHPTDWQRWQRFDHVDKGIRWLISQLQD